MTDTIMDPAALATVLPAYGTPPRDLVFKKGSADYVGHADITAILIKVDPCWTWEPQAWDPAGGPLVVDRGGRLTMWGWMTVHGKRLPCVGTVESKKLEQAEAKQGPPEVDKELIGDLIRNGAMRFGIGLNLWTKADWAEPEQGEAPEPTDFHGWKSRKAHDEWWTVQSQRLKALNPEAKDAAIKHLNDAALFDGRAPRKGCPPFFEVHREEIEAIINGAERLTAPLVAHSQHAIDVLADALDCDPLSPPEDITHELIEPWMWDLAEVEDLDAYDWKPVIAATKCRMVGLLSRAQMVADRLVAAGQEVLVPDNAKDINGAVATELRVSLLRQEDIF